MIGETPDEVAGPVASIIVRCLNEAEHLPALFDGLKKQSFRDFEVIVVDSGSTDGTLELLAGEDVTLLHIAKDEFSFGRSLNLGCGAARGEFLVFISAHCHPVDEHWLANLLDGFEDPQVAAVYGKQRGVESSHFSERQIFKRWFPEQSMARQEEPFSNNANCAIRRSLWEQFSYDEDLPGLEDTAWASKVMRHGWWISYRADAGVLHVHNESPTQTMRRYQREAITFQRIFPHEHFNIVDFVRLSIRNILKDWSEARREGVFVKEAWYILRFRMAQFLGTYRGFHTRWPGSSDLKRRFYYPEEG
jgi:glycosyltransferase involved in cell wall biosynthesis